MEHSNNQAVMPPVGSPENAKRAYSTPKLSELGKVTSMPAGGCYPSGFEAVILGCMNAPVFIAPCMS